MKKFAIAAAALALAAGGTASADVLYGIDVSDSSIFALDTSNGNINKYFGFPASSFGGLDFDSAGNLYLEQFGSLYQIDNLGAGQFHEIGSNNGRAFESFEIIGNTGYAADVFDGGIYTVNLSDNSTGFVGFHGDSNSRITGMSSNEGNTLYGARIFQADIVSVNPGDGSVTGTIASGLPSNVTSLATGSSNNLYFIPAFDTNLYSVDIGSGQVSVVLSGLSLGHVSGLTNIPAPGALAALGLAGLVATRRRR